MNKKIWLIAAVVCLLFCFGFLFSQEAQAQGTSLAEREGLQRREIDTDKLPGRFELGLAIGSTIAMVAVYKYL